MTVSNAQVSRLITGFEKCGETGRAAAKAGMDRKTARIVVEGSDCPQQKRSPFGTMAQLERPVTPTTTWGHVTVASRRPRGVQRACPRRAIGASAPEPGPRTGEASEVESLVPRTPPRGEATEGRAGFRPHGQQ